jgi:4-amino-4-deoxy-L-arabinose transferase-like glycosyltransferase
VWRSSAGEAVLQSPTIDRSPATAWQPRERPRLALTLAVFLASLIAFLPGLGGQYVWSRDEARPALVAREMLAAGHWAIPHIGGRPYTAKPPLFPAVVALVSPRGVSEWSLRIPSAVAAAATVALTYTVGAYLLGAAAGLTAAAILASSVTFFQWARTGRMEMLLVLFITLGVWSLVRWLETGQARHAALLGVWMGLGILTKGPMALVPGVIAAVMVAARPRRPRLRAHAGLCVLATASIVLLWVAVAWLTSADFAAYARELAPRFYRELGEARSRSTPLLIAGGFLPWTLAVPAAAILLARSWRAAGPALLVPAVWAATVLVIVSATLAPREAYFLSLYPPLALGVAYAWQVATERWLGRLLYPVSLLALGLVVLTAGLLLSRGSLVVPIGDGGIAVRASWSTLAAGLCLVLAMLAGHAGMRTGRRTLAVVGTAVGVLGFFVLVETGVRTPTLNRAMPTREAASRLAAAIPAHASVAYVDHRYTTALAFYLPQRTIQLGAPSAFGALRGRRDVFLLVTEDEVPLASDAGAAPVVPLARECFDDICYAIAAFAQSSIGSDQKKTFFDRSR